MASYGNRVAVAQTWLNNQIALASSVAGFATGVGFWYNDFCDDLNFDTTGTTGTAPVDLGVQGGVIQIDSGVGVSKISKIRNHGAVALNYNAQAEKWGIFARAHIGAVALPDATTLLAVVDLINAGETFFGAVGSVSTAFWTIYTTDGSSATAVTTGAIAAGWYDFGLIHDGTTLRAYVNGSPVGSLANTHVKTNDGPHFECYASNGANATRQIIRLDKALHVTEGSTF